VQFSKDSHHLKSSYISDTVSLFRCNFMDVPKNFSANRKLCLELDGYHYLLVTEGWAESQMLLSTWFLSSSHCVIIVIVS